MNKSTLIASLLTVVIVVGLVIYRFLWAASQMDGWNGLGQLPKLLKRWRRLLFDEPNSTPR